MRKGGATNSRIRGAKHLSPRRRSHGRRAHRRSSGLRLWLAAFLGLCVGIGLLWQINRLSPRTPYHEEIAAASRRYGLASELVMAVIRQESNFRSDAVSRVGARGLMQLMPETVDDIALRRGAQTPGDRIFEPRINLDYGCWYMRYLLDRFDGETATAIAAYNAGPGIVAQWLEDTAYSADGRTLKTIPYNETAHYVERVLGYWADYKKGQ